MVRHVLGTRKIGHAGTLDPLATGLLVMGVGRGTRLLRFLADLSKTYSGTGLLGVETDTLDADGRVVRRHVVRIHGDDLLAAMMAFVGEIEQLPPAYSAVKVGGERLYRAARRGEAVERPTRTVRVRTFDLVEFDPPRFDFLVECSGGTYVRSLVADVGTRLGCGASLASLRRIAIGPFDVREARSPTDPGELLPLDAAVVHLPTVVLTEEEARAAGFGRILAPAGVGGPYRALAPDGRFIAIYRDTGTKSVPEVVLAPN
jgi:tRNA pseudouridine55 synthase